MNLSQNLEQFMFDLETSDLLNSYGRSHNDIRNELSSLGFNNNVLSLMLENRRLLKSVLLRLTLYSENNLSEDTIRQNLMKLNNNTVNSLVDHLFVSSNNAVTNQEMNVTEDTNLEESDNDQDNELNDDTVLLNNFFNECVSVTQESTDIVRSSEFYTALSNWWSSESVDLPDKKALKSYLNDRLGKASKNTWSNVALN